MPKGSTHKSIDLQPPLVARRRYDSRVRRARVEQTRERVLAAAAELARRARRWDWRKLTIAAIAREAGVSERTIYRYFATERQLHETLMRRLEADAGLCYEQLSVADLPTLATSLFASLRTFAMPTAITPRGPTFVASDERRREAILRAVGELTHEWPENDKRRVAAMIDILATPLPYERLVMTWKFEVDDAVIATNWALSVLVDAIRADIRPSGQSKGRKNR